MGKGTTKLIFRRKTENGIIEAPLTIDNELKEVLDKAIRRNFRDWDYLSIVAGTSGTGKSQFAKNTLAPYCCRWFSTKYIALTAKEFINITTKCPMYSSVMLDESFAPLNSRIMFTPEFLRIVNHLQLVRQKRLFIFLCLPNYFDLAKGISIFRSNHLFVPYETKDGKRGNFAAFDRTAKRELFVLGQKFMNYNAREPSFRGRFFKNSEVVDEEIYQIKKKRHFIRQNKKLVSGRPTVQKEWDKNKFVYELYHYFRKKYKELHPESKKPFAVAKDFASALDMTEEGVISIIRRYRNKLNEAENKETRAFGRLN